MLLIGLLCIGVIITVHEFGHYFFAKLFSVSVHEFAIGIGPKLYSRQGKHTLFTLRAFPLGGFCKLESFDTQALEQLSPAQKKQPIRFIQGSLYAVSYGKRVLILLGGIIANIVFFYLLFFLLFIFQYKQNAFRPDIEPIENSPAIEAGLQTGDTITAINTMTVQSFEEIRSTLEKFAGESVTIYYTRNNASFSTIATLNAQPPVLGIRPFVAPVIYTFDASSKASLTRIKEGDTIQAINTQPVINIYDYYSILQSIKDQVARFDMQTPDGTQYHVDIELESNPVKELGIYFPQYKIAMTFSSFIQTTSTYIIEVMRATFGILIKLFTFNTSEITQNAAGPIRLMSIIGSITANNISTGGIIEAILGVIRITALISLGIGIFNLLPIPVLDGGHIFFHSIFAILRKIPSYRSVSFFNTFGVIILLTLFILVAIKDISFLIQ